MRIVAGKFKGTKIATPAAKDHSIRPSSDRLRESLFNILTHRDKGDSLRNARTLDLFSGTGAMGLEALSRGAGYCLFIDHDPAALALIRRNVTRMDLTDNSMILRRDATRLGVTTMTPFNLLLADPPYDQNLGPYALTAAATGGWLTPGALCIIEDRHNAHITLPEGFTELERRHYGEAQILILRWRDNDSLARPEIPDMNIR